MGKMLDAGAKRGRMMSCRESTVLNALHGMQTKNTTERAARGIHGILLKRLV